MSDSDAYTPVDQPSNMVDLDYYPGYLLAIFIGFISFLKLRNRVFDCPELHDIPTVGYSGWISSRFWLFQFVKSGHDLLYQGCAKYSVFKIAQMNHWMIVVNSPDLINELRLAKASDICIHEAFRDNLQVHYTLGPGLENRYHVDVVRSPLTRNLGARYPDIYDEIVVAFRDVLNIPATDKWSSVSVYRQLALPVVCRTSNRLFVGIPLCREPDYIDLNTKFTLDVSKTAALINLFPQFLQPIVGPILSPVRKSMRQARKHLVPFIARRIALEETYGEERLDRPNDLISWLLDRAVPEERTPELIAQRVLLINFGAIHTSSITFTQVLFNLAARPEYVAPLRQEVNEIVRSEGWTKSSIVHMYKIDSFIRESMRVSGFQLLTMFRKVVNDDGFTFSDGSHVPVGNHIGVPADFIHHRNFPDADCFDGFRFSKLREPDSVKYAVSTTSLDFVSFGHGRDSCPGRFFASVEIKTMLAHVVSNYDIKLVGGVRPPDTYFGMTRIPSMTAEIMFRRRQETL